MSYPPCYGSLMNLPKRAFLKSAALTVLAFVVGKQKGHTGRMMTPPDSEEPEWLKTRNHFRPSFIPARISSVVKGYVNPFRNS